MGAQPSSDEAGVAPGDGAGGDDFGTVVKPQGGRSPSDSEDALCQTSFTNCLTLPEWGAEADEEGAGLRQFEQARRSQSFKDFTERSINKKQGSQFSPPGTAPPPPPTTSSQPATDPGLVGWMFGYLSSSTPPPAGTLTEAPPNAPSGLQPSSSAASSSSLSTGQGTGQDVAPAKGASSVTVRESEYEIDDGFAEAFKDTMVRSGFPMHKLTSKGKLVPRVIKLNQELTELSWSTKQAFHGDHKIHLSDVFNVEPQKWTSASTPYHLKGKLVTITTNRDALDMQLQSEDEVDSFVRGLRAVVAEHKARAGKDPTALQ